MLVLIPFPSVPRRCLEGRIVVGGHFPLSGVTNEVLIQIWNRGLCWLLSPGLGVGGEGRAKQLVPTPEGPGFAERPRVGSGLGPMLLESSLARLPAV